MDDITYTSYEAARILGVAEGTIRLRCKKGLLAGAYRGVLRTREIWMIPAVALGMPVDLGKGVDDVLPHQVSKKLETS